MVGLGAGHLTRSHFSEALKSSRPGQESSVAPTPQPLTPVTRGGYSAENAREKAAS